jgi:putative peptidoglycan lipid II flippase
MAARAVLTFFNREIRGLHEAAYVLAFFTLGSQLFALVRDRLLAHTFGAGETLDIFYAAFRIPDVLYALLASLVSLFVLIPFLEEAHRDGKEAVRDFLSHMVVFFSGALVVIGLVTALCAPLLIGLLYPGFSEGMRAELVPMMRIILIQPLLLGMSNLFAAYVQIRGRFLLYAVAPILYNIGIIIGIVVLYPVLGTTGLAWGVVLGALFHLGIQVPFIVHEGVLPRFVTPDWKKVYDVVRISIPRTITLSSQQLVTLALVSLASLYTAGTVTSLSFAWNLQAVPLALIGASYSVAAFPKLVRLFTEGNNDQYRELIVTTARQIIFWGMPAAALVIILRAQIVRVILGSGAFNWDATRLTGAFLAVFVVSLVAQGLVVLLVRACYAAGKTKIPLLLTGISSLVTVGTALALLYGETHGVFSMNGLLQTLDVAGVTGAEALLIAVAFSLGSVLNVILLLVYFERTFHSIIIPLLPTFFESLVASVIAGMVTYGGLNVVASFISTDTGFGILLQGLGAGVLGGIAWMLSLITLGSDDLISALNALLHRVNKTRLFSARGSIEEA